MNAAHFSFNSFIFRSTSPAKNKDPETVLSSKAAFADKSSDDGMCPVELYRVSTNKELN